jgi:hypothetical protein
VTFKPQDLWFSSSHGDCPTTSAGCTTRMVSPVLNLPTTGCKRQVFSRGVTRPNVPHTPTIFRKTTLIQTRGHIQYCRIVNSWRKEGIALTWTCSEEQRVARRPWFADKQKWHHTVGLWLQMQNDATYQVARSTPSLSKSKNIFNYLGTHTLQ